MKWPWHRQPDPPVSSPVQGPTDLDEARAARRQSTSDYLRTVDQNLEVHQTSERLRKRREANHFAELLQANGWGNR